jgi:hypothetical protein
MLEVVRDGVVSILGQRHDFSFSEALVELVSLSFSVNHVNPTELDIGS